MKPRSRHTQGGQLGPVDPVIARAITGTMRLARYVDARDHRARLIRDERYIKTSARRNQMPGTPRGSWNEIHWLKQTQRDTKDDD